MALGSDKRLRTERPRTRNLARSSKKASHKSEMQRCDPDLINAVIPELLVRGLDDWIDLAEVVWVVRSSGLAKTKIEIVDRSLEVIRILLAKGYANIGEVVDKDGLCFNPWSNAAEDAVARIRRLWQAADQPLRPGDICWLENTPLGDQVAKGRKSETDS